jgi:hypothetical protein
MPGIQDYFGPDTLLFFEAGNSTDLARAMERAYFHPAGARESVERGQQVYLEHTWSQERRTLVKLAAELLQDGKSR